MDSSFVFGVTLPLTFATRKTLGFYCLLNEVTNCGTVTFGATKPTNY